MNDKQIRMGAIVREREPKGDTPLRVRGVVTEFIGPGTSNVRVVWPWKPDGAIIEIAGIYPVDELEVESESVAMLTKRLLAGEEEAKKELGIEILNKLAVGGGVQEIKDLLEAWDIPIPHRRFRAKVTMTFMAEGTYLGGVATVNGALMTEGFKVDDDASTEILVSMEDEEWGSVVLDDPYLTISEFEEVEQEKES